MFGSFAWVTIGQRADSFVSWLMPVVLLAGGMALGLSVAGFVIGLLRQRGGDRPNVGNL